MRKLEFTWKKFPNKFFSQRFQSKSHFGENFFTRMPRMYESKTRDFAKVFFLNRVEKEEIFQDLGIA